MNAQSFVEALAGCRVVPLSRGLIAIVDEEDYESVSKNKWCADAHGYAVRAEWREDRYGAVGIKMHRQILGVPSGVQVDHRNHLKSDNRRFNLRLASDIQNKCNRGIQRNNSCGFKGVHFCKKQNKWRAMIRLNKKRFCLGRFQTKELAHAAYCDAAKKLHGEFARFN